MMSSGSHYRPPKDKYKSIKRGYGCVDQWVVFGFGNYLSDIIDIIHSNGGWIKTIVGNIEYSDEEKMDLHRRLSFLNYKPQVMDLVDFRAQNAEKYCYGINGPRARLIRALKQSHGIKFSNIIHTTAYLGSNVSLGEGVCIGPGCVIGPNCRIGNFCLINRASTMGHDVVMEDYSTINPGVSVAGLVKIGCGTTIGIGATVIDKIHIGHNSMVGAGSVVVRDVPDDVVVVGTPAKIIRTNSGSA
jgi:sugar O-acyltransferase (sialic acid O-acetyltransferase NeuD family)